MFKAARFISLCRSVSQTQKHLENSYGNYKADLGLFSNQRPDLLVERIILLLGAQTGGRYFFFRYLFRKHIQTNNHNKTIQNWKFLYLRM